jgi:hypothetical protein
MIAEAALLLAMLLHAPPGYVDAVYRAGGLAVVALVSCENVTWNPRAVRREPRGHTSYGFGQIDDEWHDQHRGDLSGHIAEMVRIWRDECPGTEPGAKAEHYNGGTYPPASSVAWGRIVQRKYDSLALYLWRRLR